MPKYDQLLELHKALMDAKIPTENRWMITNDGKIIKIPFIDKNVPVDNKQSKVKVHKVK
jgi:hypothetical protein